MNTTTATATATTTRAAKTFACTACKGHGVRTEYGRGLAWTARCIVCKGRKVVSASRWLRLNYAAPRAIDSRSTAISQVCFLLGINDDGTKRMDADLVHPSAGLAGSLVDCDEHGWNDITARALKFMENNGRALWASECRALMAQVAEVRAAL